VIAIVEQKLVSVLKSVAETRFTLGSVFMKRRNRKQEAEILRYYTFSASQSPLRRLSFDPRVTRLIG
jgi:hypothetical protein